MTQVTFTDPRVPAVLNFDSLGALFQRGSPADEDLSLCFMCLRWTTGDEGCRRGDRCELLQAQDQLGAATLKGVH